MWKFLRILAWTSLIIGASIGVLRLSAIRWWQIPLNDPYFEASIAPSLRGGDWVLLWRASPPAYGDLVLCPEPKTPSRIVIGRIVAEQGDHIKVDGNSLTVNDHGALTEGSCEKFRVHEPAKGDNVELGCSRETVGSRTHLRGNTNPDVPKPSETEFDSIPNGQVFLASDDRQFPWDSREFGLVDRATCQETVVFRLISKDGFFNVPNRLTLIH